MQLISLFTNIRDSAIMLILMGEIKKQRDSEYLNLFFVKASNSKNPFKSLHAFKCDFWALKSRSESVKRGFFNTK